MAEGTDRDDHGATGGQHTERLTMTAENETEAAKGLEHLEKQDTNILWMDSHPDCAVCLQKCHYPIQLPCGHIFCFLCAKGVSARGRRCALCRAGIPTDYFDKPLLIKTRSKAYQTEDTDNTEQEVKPEEYKWYYEGRNGWWQYEDRACAQLEDDFSKGKRISELLIAGFIYLVDLVNMVQIRKNYPSRRRRIKRDKACAQKKGIAGLKNVEQGNTECTSGVANESRKENETAEDDRDSCVARDQSSGAGQSTNASRVPFCDDEDVERVTEDLDRTL